MIFARIGLTKGYLLSIIHGLWKAALYEGVKSNGASFVLPLTDAHAGREERTERLREAAAEARQGWAIAEARCRAGQRDHHTAKQQEMPVAGAEMVRWRVFQAD